MLDYYLSQSGEFSPKSTVMNYLLHQTVTTTSSLLISGDGSSVLETKDNNNNITTTNQTHCPLDSNQQPQQMYVQLSTFWYCFLALITTIGLLVSLVSNMIIIYLFTSTASLRRNPSNIIAANLSLSDLLYCIQWPSVIYCSLTQSTWILEYESVCQSFGFITLSTALASILTVLAMSVERAIVIMYTMQARKRFTNRWAWFIIVVIWIISLLSALPPLFGSYNRYTLDPSKTSCTLDYLTRQSDYKLFILVLYGAYWIAPTIVITISYILIIVTFKKSSLSLKSLDSDYESGTSHLRFTPTTMQQAVIKTHKLNVELAHNEIPARRLQRNPSRRLSSNIERPYDSRLFAPRNSEPTDQDPNSPAMFQKLSLFEDGLRSKPKQYTKSTYLFISKLRRQEGVQDLPNTSFKRNTSKTKLKSLNSSSLDSKPVTSPNQSTHANNSQITRTALQFRLAKMSFYLILLWLVSWTPIASLALVNAVRKCHKASATAVFISSTMTKLGPTFDVFIYGISHPKTKSKFKHLIKWPFTARKSSPDFNRTSLVNSVPLEAVRSVAQAQATANR